MQDHRHSQRASPGVTPRSIIIGAILSLVIGLGLPYGGLVVNGTRLGLSSCTPAAFFLLFVWILGVHIILGLIRRKWMLNRGELVTIYVMMMVATAIPTRGFTAMLLPMITGATYYAQPENRWGELVLPFLPSEMVVNDPTGLKYFYEGLPKGESIPWDIWVSPLPEPSIAGRIWTGVGAAVMAVLTFAQYRFVWWPFHPLGFMVSAGWIMGSLWFPIFLAWFFKVMVLKFGGGRLYERLRPFFLGIVLGVCVTGGCWLVRDAFAGTYGHHVRMYS